MNLWRFFSDPILRAPTIGSMLLCAVAAIVGVLVFLRKRSLLGESLAHATYPGVTSAILCAGCFSLEKELPFVILSGAFVTALIGFFVINLMEKKFKTSADAALTAVLSLFFGIGVTFASIAQNGYPHLYRQMQAYLYGQTATMTDIHVALYSVLTLFIVFFIVIFYKEILTLTFDASFAQTSGVAGRFLEPLIFCIIVLALVMGVRCAGVVLMSAMLIAPAVAARQFTNRLSHMFVWAGFFGALSGFLGIYSSVILSESIKGHYGVPTGPIIVLISGLLALFALLFAPKRGLLIRYFRIACFRAVCAQENVLKAIWRYTQENRRITVHFLAQKMGFPNLYTYFLLSRLVRQYSLYKDGKSYHLTSRGNQRGAQIVRLHRLWEAYLVYSLGQKIERVHKSAEEMEHILTPELEKKLTLLLDDPKQDPHDQPIPTLRS